MNSNKKLPSPKVLEALKFYEVLRDRQMDYYFSHKPLKITNDDFLKAYTDVFKLINQEMQVKIEQQKYHEKYQETLLFRYREDLKNFCLKCKDMFKESKSMEPIERQNIIAERLADYKRFLNWVARIFKVIQGVTLKNKGIYIISEGLKILRKQLIEEIYPQLFNLCLTLLQLYKNQSLHDLQQLQQIIITIGVCGFSKFLHVKLKLKMYTYQFYSENSSTHQMVQSPFQTDYFKKNFTNKLIHHLQSEYRATAEQLMKLSVPQYINKSLQLLKKQQDTADKFYAIKSVKDLIIRSIQQVLVLQRAHQLIQKQSSGLRVMLDKKDILNIKKMYIFMKRSQNLKMLVKEYQSYIENRGYEIMDKVTAEEERLAKKQAVNAMIAQLCDFYESIDGISSQVSEGDLDFYNGQNFAFQQICNKTNKVTNFLAYYADNVLRKQESSYENNNDLISKIGKISKFLYSYDAFLKMYQKLLGLRILYDNFRNQDTEFSIINLLKNQAGVTALNKISCMISDYKYSEAFNQQKFNQGGLSFNMQVMILTSSSWQIQDKKLGKSLVPPQLLPAVQKYQQTYLQWTPGRTITWLFNYGRAIVQATFKEGKYLLIINNYQLLILFYLQRQNFKKAKISQLLSQLKIDDEGAFIASILMLAKAGVIVKEGVPGKIQSKQQRISFNIAFKSPKSKVGCFQVPKYIEKGNQQTTELTVQRSYLIDAAIVKAMKTNRVMSYNELIAEVQKMCKTFRADVGLIKKRIENCQQRDFLVRDEKDMNKLLYKP